MRRGCSWPTPTGRDQLAVSPELFDDVHAIDWSPDGNRLMVLGDLLRNPVRAMSILVLAADGTGSGEPIDLGEVSPQWVGRLASSRR